MAGGAAGRPEPPSPQGADRGRSSLMTERKPGPHYIIERIVKWERERYCRVIEAETQRVVIEAPWDELHDRMDELAAGQKNVTSSSSPWNRKGGRKIGVFGDGL